MAMELRTPKNEVDITTFEQAETLLACLLEIAGQYQGELETLRDRAEQMACDIASTDEKADAELACYRAFLDDGEKAQADAALETVSGHRKRTKDLRAELVAMLPEIGKFKERIEVSWRKILSFAETKFLLDIQRRLPLALGHQGQVFNAFTQTAVQLDKLAGFIRKNTNGF